MTVTNEQIQALRDKFESSVMEKICISKSTLIGLRTDEGYRNSTLSGHDYQGDWEFFLAGYSCSQAERDADKALIANLTSERDALREGEMGDGKYSNTRAAADIYFQLAEECDIPPGGSLVQHIDMMRDRIAELEASLKAAEINETDARCHVAELQDRTLTVKLPRDITHVTNKYFEDGRDAVIEAIESQLAAAGITLVVGE